MRHIKSLILIVLTVGLIPIVFLFLLNVLSKINPQYTILNNGEKGYYMATENVLLSGLLTIAIVLFGFIIGKRKLKK